MISSCIISGRGFGGAFFGLAAAGLAAGFASAAASFFSPSASFFSVTASAIQNKQISGTSVQASDVSKLHPQNSTD
jgi:hypothetical protein